MTESKKHSPGLKSYKFSLELNKGYFQNPNIVDDYKFSNAYRVKNKILSASLPLRIENKLLKLINTLDKENINLAEEILNTYPSGKMEL